MKILVTGGAGYLGSVLVPLLLDKGHQVTVVDNLMFGQQSLLACCSNPLFSFIRGDSRDEILMADLAKKADVIIPLAALVGAPLCAQHPEDTVSINRDAIMMLDKHRSQDQMMLVPITNSGYGVGDEGKFCTEESALRPISLYGRMKVELEQALLSGGNVISFRLATVFGASPRMRTDLLVNDFVYRAVFDRVVVLFESHFKRNYIHIRDVARVFLHGINNYVGMKGQPYNVGLSDANLSKKELCQVIKRHLPEFVFIESEIGQDPDKRDYIVSNDRIESTGWKPKYSLDDGIRELKKVYAMIKNNEFSNV